MPPREVWWGERAGVESPVRTLARAYARVCGLVRENS